MLRCSWHCLAKATADAATADAPLAAATAAAAAAFARAAAAAAPTAAAAAALVVHADDAGTEVVAPLPQPEDASIDSAATALSDSVSNRASSRSSTCMMS